jgi:hypothetical protein
MKPDGSFELCGLPPGTYVASIHTAGEVLATTRDATYPVQAVTTVQVYDGKDTPIHFPPRQPRASLEIDFLNNPEMWGLCLTDNAYPEVQGVKMMTQGKGTYRIHEIPPGNYTLSLGRGMMCDRGEYVEHLTLGAGEHIVLEIDLPEE